MVDNEMLLAFSNIVDEKLKNQLEPIRRDIKEMKTEIGEMKTDIREMKAEIGEMKAEISEAKADILKIQICQETNILPRLQNIEGCYLSTYQRYQESADENRGVRDDVDLLKRVVQEHSIRLQLQG